MFDCVGMNMTISLPPPSRVPPAAADLPPAPADLSELPELDAHAVRAVTAAPATRHRTANRRRGEVRTCTPNGHRSPWGQTPGPGGDESPVWMAEHRRRRRQ